MKVDGVFSGGGIKAFAFLGALQVLEQHHIQFERVAGTSAGAIVASFLAAGYNAKEIEQLLDELDVKSLLDPPKLFVKMPILKWLNLYFRQGLYKGKQLENWFYEKLAKKNVYTFKDIKKGTLKLVTSDLTNGKLMVIPDDLPSYGIDSDNFSVALALRMSCGIPFFFEPVKLKNNNQDIIIVDGGVLSNFPIWIFDNGNKRSVLGLKLSSPKEGMPPQKITNTLNLFEALFYAMKDAHDERYISRKHEKNIIFIPVEKYSATQFDLDEQTKQTLIEIGKNRTSNFLETWPPYLRQTRNRSY